MSLGSVRVSRAAGEVGTGSETFTVIKFECLDDPGRTPTLTARAE